MTGLPKGYTLCKKCGEHYHDIKWRYCYFCHANLEAVSYEGTPPNNEELINEPGTEADL